MLSYMLLGRNESTEDAIVRLLAHSEKEVKDLHGLLEKEHEKKISIQAVYKAVNGLLEDAILVKKGKTHMVNKEWAQSLVRRFESAETPALSEGEAVSYQFKSLSALDAYWKHTVVQLHATLGKYPIFFYNSHVVWIHVRDRKESQRNYLDSFDAEHKYAYFIVGGDTALDKDFRKEFNREYLQVELRKIDAIKYDSVTVHADYVVTVKFSKGTSNAVERLYAGTDSAAALERGLEESFRGGRPIRLTIERNKRRADSIRKVLAKNVYIPSEIKKEFDLPI